MSTELIQKNGEKSGKATLQQWRADARAKSKPDVTKEPEVPAASTSQQQQASLVIGKAEYEAFGTKFLRAQAWVNFRDMRRDAVVDSCLSLKTCMPLRHGYTIEAASESAEHEKQAEFVRWALEQIEPTPYAIIEKALDAVAVGFSAQEKIWSLQREGEHAGKLFIKGTVAADPQNVSFEVDEFWRVNELRVTIPGKIIREKFPVGKFIYWRYHGCYETPYGFGDFQKAFRAWFVKNECLKLWVTRMERVAVGTRVAKYAEGTTTPQQLQLFEEMKKAVAPLFIGVPSTVDLSILEAGASGDGEFSNIIAWADMQIARAILGAALSVDEGSRVGSKAMAQVHLSTSQLMSTQLARQVETEIVGDQVIKPLIDANFPGVTEYPKFKLPQPDPNEISALAERVNAALDRGVIAAEEKWIRPALGFQQDERTPEEIAKATAEKQQAQIDNGNMRPGPGQNEQQPQEESSNAR